MTKMMHSAAAVQFDQWSLRLGLYAIAGMKDIVPRPTEDGYEGFEELIDHANTWLKDQCDTVITNMQSVMVQKDDGIQFSCNVHLKLCVPLFMLTHYNIKFQVYSPHPHMGLTCFITLQKPTSKDQTFA